MRPLRRAGGGSREHRSKLGARRKPQLPEDAREMTFDGSRGDEERLRDLSVGQTLTRKLRDPAFARGERLEPRQDDPARPRSGRSELDLRALCKQLRAGPV